MKRIMISLAAILFISCITLAQKNTDALYLKNGSIVYGKLVEVKDKHYKIKTSDGLLFTFGPDEVEKFILGEKPKPEELKPVDPNGWGFGIESGLMLGSSENNFPILFSFNPGVTYTFRNRQTITMLTGVEMFDQFVLPLTFEYRFNLLDKDVTPFIYTRGGGLLALGGEDSSNDYKGGWTLGLGTGFRWPISRFESYIKLGFRYTYTVYEGSSYNYYNGTYYYSTFHSNFYRLEMKWGFRF